MLKSTALCFSDKRRVLYVWESYNAIPHSLALHMRWAQRLQRIDLEFHLLEHKEPNRISMGRPCANLLTRE